MKVYITDCDQGSVSLEEKVFKDAGLEFEWLDCKSEDDVIEKCQDAAGLLCQYVKIGEKTFSSLPNLKVVSRYGVGVDNIDVEAAKSHNVQVCNVPDYCQGEVSTHAFALLLDLIRHVASLSDDTKHGGWNCQSRGKIHRMQGRVIGLLGLGATGRKMAKKALGFDLKVIGYDPFVSEEKAKEIGVEKADLERIFKESDYISLHLPLTEDTKDLVNDERLAMIKEGCLLVNTSRGGIVDEDALATALDSGKLDGAALDVLKQEPPEPNHPLLNRNNVIVTPHAAFYSEEAYIELKTKAAQNVTRVLANVQDST